MKLNKNNIFLEIHRLIIDTCLIINEYEGVLESKNPYTKQLKTDIEKGFVRLGGVLVPLKEVGHKIMFEGFEINIIKIFVTLIENILENTSSSLSQFSLRTIAELSFRKIQILFSDKLLQQEKNKYKTICLLADYGFMTSPEYASDYEKLFREYGASFTDKQKKALRDLHLSVVKNEERQQLIKKVRQYIADTENGLLKKTEIVPLFTQKRIDAIFSSFSHILHGDILLLMDLFNLKRRKSHKLRVYSIIMFSVINAVNCLSKQLKDKSLLRQIKEVNEGYTEIEKYISINWKELERD